MWGTVGFLVGFLAAGAVWVTAGLPFPIPTRFPIGVVLALAVPYGFVAEAVGHKIDAVNLARGLRLWLAGVGCGAAALATELGALWAVAPREWALVAVWLASPVGVVAALVALGLRPPGGGSDRAEPPVPVDRGGS